jgi:tripartite-type tricarboxylate transporter receptor subunit TctC
MRSRFISAGFACVFGCVFAASHAQDIYPNRTITLTIGFAAGGKSDG